VALGKTEIGLYAAGGVGLLASVALLASGRRRAGWPTLALTGALFTAGGATTYHRRRKTTALDGPLGLVESERVHSGGMRLRAYDDAEMGLKERVHLLQGLVADSVKDPVVRKKGLEITNKCPARDDKCELQAIFDYTAQNIRYSGDLGAHALSPGGPVEPVDTFQSAKRTIEFGAGDCDCQGILNASLAVVNGFPVKFRITSNTGSSWDHIYALAGTPKMNPRKWTALDTTLRRPKLGLQPRRAKYVDYDA